MKLVRQEAVCYYCDENIYRYPHGHAEWLHRSGLLTCHAEDKGTNRGTPKNVGFLTVWATEDVV
jgi:hypothetical protein